MAVIGQRLIRHADQLAANQLALSRAFADLCVLHEVYTGLHKWNLVICNCGTLSISLISTFSTLPVAAAVEELVQTLKKVKLEVSR